MLEASARAPMRGASSCSLPCAASPCAVRPLGSNPCAHAHDCHVMRRITYHLILATFVLHHARSKIQRRLSSGDAKCKVRHIAPHRPRHARARASVRECELGCSAPFTRTLVCASMKQ
ncbi:hypothetical protein Hdeb2414_s0006g00194181 [Helianthus debilis subsp. tardiflorus]